MTILGFKGSQVQGTAREEPRGPREQPGRLPKTIIKVLLFEAKGSENIIKALRFEAKGSENLIKA